MSTSTAALVAFLRCEADMAEDRAKRLYAQAEAMAIQFGVTEEEQQAYELDPIEMAPLDENGIPKYKGRKRGRKAKKRKRPRNPNLPKRKHTAYTLFVQENYPSIREHNPTLPSKDLISIVAKQWAQVSDLEKQAWKQRALDTITEQEQQEHYQHVGGGIVEDQELEEEDDEEEEEEDDEDEESEEEDESPKKKQARQRKK